MYRLAVSDSDKIKKKWWHLSHCTKRVVAEKYNKKDKINKKKRIQKQHKQRNVYSFLFLPNPEIGIPFLLFYKRKSKFEYKVLNNVQLQ